MTVISLTQRPALVPWLAFQARLTANEVAKGLRLRIQMLNDTLLMMAFLASAAAVPLITVPGWWADISRAFPLTSGVANLYDVLIQHQQVTSPWGDGGLLPLSVTAVGYLLAGIVAFRLGERTAKRRGTLARY